MNLQTQLYMNDRIFPIGIKVVTLHKYIYIYLFDLGNQVIVRKRAIDPQLQPPTRKSSLMYNSTSSLKHAKHVFTLTSSAD